MRTTGKESGSSGKNFLFDRENIQRGKTFLTERIEGKKELKKTEKKN